MTGYSGDNNIIVYGRMKQKPVILSGQNMYNSNGHVCRRAYNRLINKKQKADPVSSPMICTGVAPAALLCRS